MSGYYEWKYAEVAPVKMTRVEELVAKLKSVVEREKSRSKILRCVNDDLELKRFVHETHPKISDAIIENDERKLEALKRFIAFQKTIENVDDVREKDRRLMNFQIEFAKSMPSK